MRSGVNALIIGNYLTTLGRSPQEDLAMLGAPLHADRRALPRDLDARFRALRLRQRPADPSGMAVPSIKGSAFQSVVHDLAELIKAGKIAREAVEARLEAEDLLLLDDKILPGLWYALASYRRMTELLWEVEGNREPAYLMARGARSAERLFEAGLYQQMQRGEELGAAKRERGEAWSEFDGNLMTSLAARHLQREPLALPPASGRREREPDRGDGRARPARGLALGRAGLHRVHGLAHDRRDRARDERAPGARSHRLHAAKLGPLSRRSAGPAAQLPVHEQQQQRACHGDGRGCPD